MEPFTSLTAIAAPMFRSDIDTDAIIPSKQIKVVGKTGLAAGLFAGWRYSDNAGLVLNADFVLNQPPYNDARILLGGENFGCGSSREHAVWALREYGFRAILAPSFAPIFYGNCVRNGLLPVVLPTDAIGRLVIAVQSNPGRNLVTVDLIRRQVSAPGVKPCVFAIEIAAREALLAGLDSVEVALRRKPLIDAFITRDRVARPWIYLK